MLCLHGMLGYVCALTIQLQLLLQAEMDAKIQQLQERDGEINKLPTEQRVRDKTTMKNSYIIIIICCCCCCCVQDQTPSRYEHVNIKQSPTQEPLVS